MNELDELSQKLRDELLGSLQRFRYFMLASAGAALAFTVSLTPEDYVFTLTDAFWALGGLAFALSFLFGLLAIQSSQSALSSNLIIIEVKKEAASKQINIHGSKELETQYDKVNSQHARTSTKTTIQKWLLLTGAVALGFMSLLMRLGYDPELLFC